MTLSKPSLPWVRGYYERGPGVVAGTQTATYRLSHLINLGYVDAEAARALLMDTGLLDFRWQVTWAEDYETADDDLEDRIGNVDGYAVFVHGWTGNFSIWEDLPGMLVMANRKLVSISMDHNGFGMSRFVNETPPLELCNPPAAMRALERLITLLKIRRQPGETRLKVVNMIGHSMGGAMLFYLDPMQWRMGEETRYAIAPALLLHDELHRAFFNTLGVGINLVNKIKVFEVFERILKPNVIEIICGGATEFVKQAHYFQYSDTPRGIIGSTFLAMGMLDNHEIPRTWDTFNVMLGHKDFLVGLTPMIDLLGELEFPVANIRVVPGSHYMFSVGPEYVFQHAQNRDLAAQDILLLHERALEMQKTGHKAR
jgi:hypothetical protein